MKRLFAFAALIAAGLWVYCGFPSIGTLAAWPTAEADCIKFANENRAQLFSTEAGADLKSMGMWMKNGKIVVQVAAVKPGAASYHYRLCVRSDGQVEIVSVLEQSAWR